MSRSWEPHMQRYLCGSGFVYFVALIFSIMASISVPYWPSMAIAKTHFDGAVTVLIQTSEGFSHTGNLTEIRFGSWGICYYESGKGHTCKKIDKNVIITQGKNPPVEVDWVKNLIIQPIVTGVLGFLALPFILITWSKSLCSNMRLNAGIGVYTAKPMPVILYVITMGTTVAMFASHSNNSEFSNSIESKLHKLGATKHGLGYIFTLTSALIHLFSSQSFFGVLFYMVHKERTRGEPEDTYDSYILNELG